MNRSLYGFASRLVFTATVLLAGTVLLSTGCSGKGSSSGASEPTQAPTILTQPQSQIIPIGRAATFSVSAFGPVPLSYQWSKNSVEIPGATSATYSTPPVTLGQNDSTSLGSFQVVVSNASGSTASNMATLAAGPRAPALGDLRYLLNEQVDVAGLGEYGFGPGVVESGWEEAHNAVGTPLEMGSTFGCSQVAGCAWGFSFQFLPPPMTGLNMWYKGGNYSDFASDLPSIVASNVVITSLDFEPAEDAYGVSWVQTAQPGGFDYRQEIVPITDVAATVAQDAAQSRIVTAVTFDPSGEVALISYGWQGDAQTVYETQVSIVQPGDAIAADVISAATSLSSAGYIISAFGGNDTNGYLLIATRVKGDTIPRAILLTGPSGNVLPTNPDSAYFTTVLSLHEYGSGESFTAIQEQ
jgi:hypothetical protein